MKDVVQVQLVAQSSNADTPTIQSGDGASFDARDTRWFLGSTLNTAKVLGLPTPAAAICCHDIPRAFMIVRM